MPNVKGASANVSYLKGQDKAVWNIGRNMLEDNFLFAHLIRYTFQTL